MNISGKWEKVRFGRILLFFENTEHCKRDGKITAAFRTGEVYLTVLILTREKEMEFYSSSLPGNRGDWRVNV